MNFKHISSVLTILAVMAFTLTSCFEEPDWLADNVTTEDKHFPVISGFNLVTEGDNFTEGTVIEVDLDFWSLDDIASIKLYENVDGGDPVEVASFSYTPNFQADSQTDELIMTYTIPSLPADVVSITLDAEIVNTNGLTRNSANGGTANRPSVSFTAIK